MNFTSNNRKYKIDKHGVVVQIDHRPFTYDAAYSAIYDSEQYKRNSELLQAMRFGFAVGAHGKRINSLMDVGYGNGAFIDFAKNLVEYVYGHDITGVELHDAYRMPEMVKADVYTFHDVLEHFPNIDFVKDLPCETIIVSLPYCHIMTEGKSWFDYHYPHRKPDEHIRHFNEFSLSSIMESMGWKSIAVSGHEDLIRKPKDPELQNILSMAFKRK